MWNKTKTITTIWVTAFILSNFRGTVLWDVFKQAFDITELPWIEVLIWIVLLSMTIRVMVLTNLIEEYFKLWKQNPLLIVFIGVAILSLIWSVGFSATLYRSAVLLFASLIGAYLGTRYSLKELLQVLFRFGSVLLIVCFVLAIFLPIMGAMMWEPYNGAWRGIYWHKNLFGSMVALFSLVFLVLGLDDISSKGGKAAQYFVFYAFSIVLVYFSKSVAGYFLCIAMSGLTLLVFLWLKIRHRLTSTHYYAFLGSVVIAVALVLSNLDFVFGLFNRSTSLTGRVPMWNYLFGQVIARSLWVGYGFGAIWSTSTFRITVQHAVGWGAPVATGDNGFIDILLHVGLLGFIPFMGVLITVFTRSVRLLRQQTAILDFFPFLLGIFIVMANITFSLFLDTEAFSWLVLVAVLFIVTRSQYSRIAATNPI